MSFGVWWVELKANEMSNGDKKATFSSKVMGFLNTLFNFGNLVIIAVKILARFNCIYPSNCLLLCLLKFYKNYQIDPSIKLQTN